MAVRYFVADVEKSIRFYVDLIEFELIEQWGPAFAIVERDGQSLWLSGPGTSAMKPMPDGRVPEPGGWNRIVVSMSGIDAKVEMLRSQSVVFRGELVRGPGGSQVLVEDLDGNPIELFESKD